MPITLSRVKDKFQPRGVPCIFLGYPHTQKGDKVLNLLTHTTFVTRDVVFFEHIFPYQRFSLSHCQQPIPAVRSQTPTWSADLFKCVDPQPLQPPSSGSHTVTEDAEPEGAVLSSDSPTVPSSF